MTISFGPVVSTLNYGGDAKPDQVFVVTGGGIGSIGIASAAQTGKNIKFNFASPICEGSSPGKGASSFFWALVSKTPPQFVTATLHETGGATTTSKRAPQIRIAASRARGSGFSGRGMRHQAGTSLFIFNFVPSWLRPSPDPRLFVFTRGQFSSSLQGSIRRRI